MTLPRKVFGIGFNKTGTSTLSKCFELLGLGPVASPQVLHESFMADSFRSYFPGGKCPPLVGEYGHGPAAVDPFGPPIPDHPLPPREPTAVRTRSMP
mgnify:CR=1 FL=1